MTEIETALASYIPTVAARYVELVTRLYERMVATLGPDLKNIANDWTYARAYRVTIAPHCIGRTLNADKLQANATKFAEQAVASWQAKIEAKLGELTEAKVVTLHGAHIILTGRRGNKAVRIEQEIIVNRSSKNVLFNQFPARIYIDGKFTSEAAYKKAA